LLVEIWAIGAFLSNLNTALKILIDPTAFISKSLWILFVAQSWDGCAAVWIILSNPSLNTLSILFLSVISMAQCL